MSRVSATASLGMKLSLGTKKKFGFTDYDNTNPHHSVTIERNYPDELTDEELVEKAATLHGLARSFVEKKVNQDIKDAKSAD